ncbi:uncharacterized protein LOC143915518 [Arctopsyche grandis]|uniref:uncharacterized protein LOC143915518 n=1 Tax=Arctopsyche grandis TaxID=121162 RepID=UPI00406D7848
MTGKSTTAQIFRAQHGIQSLQRSILWSTSLLITLQYHFVINILKRCDALTHQHSNPFPNKTETMSLTFESINSHMEYKRTLLAVAMIACLLLYWKSQPQEPINEEQIEQKQESNVLKLPNHNDRMLEVQGVCYDMHIFLKRPKKITLNNPKQEESATDKTVYLKKHGVNETSLIGLMLGLLIVSIIVALADVLKVKREQKSNQSSPDSDASERCSLAEFANMKRPRRESSIGGVGASSRRDSTKGGCGVAQLCRFESVGTAFSRMRRESMSAAAVPVVAGTETPATPAAGAIRTPLKLLGARPTPMLRRSSCSAVSLHDGNDQRRRLSIDSEDDSSPDTGLGRRRIRIIRRH